MAENQMSSRFIHQGQCVLKSSEVHFSTKVMHTTSKLPIIIEKVKERS